MKCQWFMESAKLQLIHGNLRHKRDLLALSLPWAPYQMDQWDKNKNIKKQGQKTAWPDMSMRCINIKASAAFILQHIQTLDVNQPFTEKGHLRYSTGKKMVLWVELIPVIDTQSRQMIYYQAKSGKHRLTAVSCPWRINKTPVVNSLNRTVVGKVPCFEFAVPTLLPVAPV